MNKSNQISTVSFIGSGNVATALGISLKQSGIIIKEVYSPNISNSKTLALKLDCDWAENIDSIDVNSDLYIIAIPDKEIGTLVKKIKKVKGIIVHTSGSQTMNVLEGKNHSHGVFYPLQTFTKSKEVDTSNIPICIEGSNMATVNSLINLAEKISNKVVRLNSEQRQYLHLAAVTVNNFSNLMYHFAHDVLGDKNIDFSLLVPLITETASKIADIKPADAQTGPAKRNDVTTINKHLELLEKYPDYKEVYQLLSKQLIRKYHDKL